MVQYFYKAPRPAGIIQRWRKMKLKAWSML